MSSGPRIEPVTAVAPNAARPAPRAAGARFADRYPALRALSIYSAALYAGQALSLVCSFLVASILGPAGFGVWRYLKLILAYLVRVGEAGTEGLRRELPEAIGAGRVAQADDMMQTLIAAHLLVGMGLAGLCAVAAKVLPRWWPAVPGVVWMAVALIVPVQIVYHIVVAALHARERVGRYSRITFAFALSSAVMIPLGAAWAGLPGALVGLFASYGGPLVWLIRCGEFPRLARPRWATLRSVWTVGLPIWMTWIPVLVLSDIDEWLVAVHLGTSALGLYGIAVGLGILLRFLPKIYGVVYQPFLLRRLGATQDWAALKPYVVQSLRLIAYSVPLAIVALYFLVDPLVALVLPAYRDAVPATKLYCLVTFWCLLPPVTFMVCVAARRTRRWLVQTLLLIAAYTVIASLVLRAGGGIVGASACRGAAYTAYSVLQIRLAMSLFGEGRRAWLPLAGALSVPFATSVLICLGLEALWPLPADPLGMAAVSLGRLSVAGVLLGAQYHLANRRWAFSRILTAPTGVPGEIGGAVVNDPEPEEAAV
jgi:O-antigen/teichoic acid export membrane protein